MPWTIDLPHRGYNRGYYTTRIRERNAKLVENPDTEFLEHILAASNVKFQVFVQSIRRVVEEMFPCINDETTLSFEEKNDLHDLLDNTNWASHGPKAKGPKKKQWPHTSVDEEHCDTMVELFDSFVDIALAYDDYEDDSDDSSDDDSDDSSDDSVKSLAGAFGNMGCNDLPDGMRYCASCGDSFNTNFRGSNPTCRPCFRG